MFWTLRISISDHCLAVYRRDISQCRQRPLDGAVRVPPGISCGIILRCGLSRRFGSPAKCGHGPPTVPTHTHRGSCIVPSSRGVSFWHTQILLINRLAAHLKRCSQLWLWCVCDRLWLRLRPRCDSDATATTLRRPCDDLATCCRDYDCDVTATKPVSHPVTS